MFKMFKTYRLNTLRERYLRLIDEAREDWKNGNRVDFEEKVEEAEIVAGVIDRIKEY